jgi:hypothetical protein
MNAKDRLLNRINDLISQGETVIRTAHRTQYSSDEVDSALFTGFRSAGLSYISNVYGTNHSYYSLFNSETTDYYTSSAKASIEILRQIKIEIDGDWIIKVKNLVSAELFSDFIEMAKYLLESKYKDPAAVLIGSVLEEHIRQLCNSNGISISEEKDGRLIPLKADRMNAELVKANVYNKLQQTTVTAWLALRNNAAHGKYSEYTIDQVILMQDGVIGFINNNPLT